MRVAIGSDHAGFELKEYLAEELVKAGYDINNLGTFNSDSVDYTDFGVKIADAIISGDCELGIAVCGTGIGITIAANKKTGIRAAACSETFSAKMARAHNNANIIGIGARVVGQGLALEIALAFLETKFEAGSRHEMRVNKINSLDK